MRINRSHTIAFAFALALALGSAANAAPHAGDAAPPFAVAQPSAGPKLALGAYRGRPLYVNFFASWCAPCNAEAPDIGRLYRIYHKRGLAIVGIDELENASKAKEFAHKYAWPFAVGLDDDGTMARDYGAIALPVHVFIDKSGKISTYRLGEMEPAEIEDAIKKIL